ncbi:hypothetical protein ACLB2K_029304 [Fragaria x ananassa]
MGKIVYSCFPSVSKQETRSSHPSSTDTLLRQTPTVIRVYHASPISDLSTTVPRLTRRLRLGTKLAITIPAIVLHGHRLRHRPPIGIVEDTEL